MLPLDRALDAVHAFRGAKFIGHPDQEVAAPRLRTRFDLEGDHGVPREAWLSYTAHGVAWIYPIFSGVALYLVFAKLGWAGLSWLCAVVAAFVVWMITRRRELATLGLAMLAVPLIADRATPRSAGPDRSCGS